ncbi:hypothetical protein AB1N83_000176 [Pleurotus pulmonarius]
MVDGGQTPASPVPWAPHSKVARKYAQVEHADSQTPERRRCQTPNKKLRPSCKAAKRIPIDEYISEANSAVRTDIMRAKETLQCPERKCR